MVYTGAHGNSWNYLTKDEGIAFCSEFSERPFSLLMAVEKRLKGKEMKYGILDDDGQVVRWVWEKPDYPHIVWRKPKFDPSGYPDALF